MINDNYTTRKIIFVSIGTFSTYSQPNGIYTHAKSMYVR